jgi:chromosome segregation ATPase
MVLTIPLTGLAANSVSGDSGVCRNQAVDTSRAKVISRLERVGYSRTEAIERVDRMTADEIEYFAQNPESIRRSGFVILASCIGSSIYCSIKSGQDKRKAYISHLNSKIEETQNEITLLQGQKENDETLVTVEKDPATKEAIEARIKNTDDQIQVKKDLIKSLENEIELVRTHKEKVPKTY